MHVQPNAGASSLLHRGPNELPSLWGKLTQGGEDDTKQMHDSLKTPAQGRTKVEPRTWFAWVLEKAAVSTILRTYVAEQCRRADITEDRTVDCTSTSFRSGQRLGIEMMGVSQPRGCAWSAEAAADLAADDRKWSSPFARWCLVTAVALVACMPLLVTQTWVSHSVYTYLLQVLD